MLLGISSSKAMGTYVLRAAFKASKEENFLPFLAVQLFGT
jgi:hypothetical protein